MLSALKITSFHYIPLHGFLHNLRDSIFAFYVFNHNYQEKKVWNSPTHIFSKGKREKTAYRPSFALANTQKTSSSIL